MTRIPAAAAEDAQTSPEPSKSRKLLYVTLPGCWGGLIFACLSFTPSLLPRGGLIQGIICGITAAIGYGLGVLAASIWRAFPDREPRRPRRWAWTVFFIAGPVLFARLVRPRAVLAVRDPQADGGDGLQHSARGGRAVRRGAGVLPVPADRARPAWPVPVAGEAAHPLDRAARGPRHRLGRGGRPDLSGGQRPAAAGLRQRDEQRLWAARHQDRRRDPPAHDQPAFWWAGIGHTVGFAGLAGPQLHRQGPVGERSREVQRPSGHGADPDLRRAGLGRRARRRRPRWPSGTCSGRAVSSARTWWW